MIQIIKKRNFLPDEEALDIYEEYTSTDGGQFGKKEYTQYKGTYCVQCFAISANKCIGISDEFVVEIL